MRKITVAGATGNLGMRVVKELVKEDVSVVALVRNSTAREKMKQIESMGAKVAVIDPSDVNDVARSMQDADCVLSVVAGLHDVVVGMQSTLLEAAISAGVPRFIPSDFSSDFTKLTPGENRNFDLRREFHEELDVAPIKSTAIFNGAFAEVLMYNIPLLDFKTKTVGYWQDPDWQIDFTTMDNTAAFTAAAALDPSTPRALRIASFQVSANDLVAFTASAFGKAYELVHLGSLEDLREHNKTQRLAHPEGEKELYSSWQQGQYMQSMFSAHHDLLDNNRYAGIEWSSIEDVVRPRR